MTDKPIRMVSVPVEPTGPYSAEFGAIHHEDKRGYLFTIHPESAAKEVARALNHAAAVEAASAAPVREEGGAQAGSDDLAARLRIAETWDLDADQEARDRCGVLMLEAAERLVALSCTTPPAPEAVKLRASDGDVWSAAGCPEETFTDAAAAFAAAIEWIEEGQKERPERLHRTRNLPDVWAIMLNGEMSLFDTETEALAALQQKGRP